MRWAPSSDTTRAIKKRYHFFVVIAVLAVFLYFAFANFPIKYSVGQVDNRFGVSKKEVINLSKDAARRWNDALGKKVLVYDANASLTIDFIYDKRQANLDKLKTEIANLNLARTNASNTKQQLEREIGLYEIDLKQFNRDVDFWNTFGRFKWDAKKRYQILQDRELELEDRRSDLMREVQLLDESIQTHNSDLANLQNELKEKESKVEKAGVYKQQENKIEVYMFVNKRHLRLLLMHEFGHAIGAKHTKNPISIMYDRIGKQNLEDPRPQKEDIDAVKNGL